MTTYQSIIQSDCGKTCDDEGNPLIVRRDIAPTTTVDQSPSHKRYFVSGSIIIALCFLGVGLHHQYYRTTTSQNVESSLAIARFCPTWVKDYCGADQVCCPETLFGTAGKCQDCCSNRNCFDRIEQPPAGEWGKPFCIDNVCQAYKNGEDSLIGEEGYPIYIPSETIDNSKEFRKYMVPRKIISDDPDDPAMESLWYFDFNDQDESFKMDDVVYNGTHITIPSFEKMHAGYSKSYKAYDEQETGIVTLILADNKYSLVADYPKLLFVEKYHTLTFDGQKDESRGEYMKSLSAEQVKEKPQFNRNEWLESAFALVADLFVRGSILSQVEAGIDRALSWQVRRYVNSYTEDGSLNPTSSSRWASHSAKAKQAIEYAKDPNFTREYLKSEQHCKHMEQGNGFTVDYTDTTVTFPLGRPVTTFSGEMVNAPTYYLGFNVGIITAHYDKDKGIFQLFYQGYANSRQYADAKFPGPHSTGLYVGPVAEGNDYVVDSHRDGRGDASLLGEQPPLLSAQFRSDVPDVTLWRRPLSERCDPETVESDFWENVDILSTDNSIFETLSKDVDLLRSVVAGMPCSSSWMNSDYGEGSHAFGINEIEVWTHMLTETRDDKVKETTLAPWWNEWEYFYQGKNHT